MVEGHDIINNIDKFLYQLSLNYDNNKETKLKDIISRATCIFDRYDYDNWNGGTYYHRLILQVPEALYSEIFENIEEYCKKIVDDLQIITSSIKDEFVSQIFIEINDKYNKNWRQEQGISKLTNEQILNEMTLNRIWGSNYDKNFKLFISHKHSIQKECHLFKEKVKEFGVSCFVAHVDVDPTQKWQDEIEYALYSCDCLIAMMTKDFHDSYWTDQEIGFAMGRQIPTISVDLGALPFGFIGKYQAIKGINNITVDYLKIFKVLIKYPKMIDSLINALRHSKNYEMSNEFYEIIQYIEELSNDQIVNIISSFKSNCQVYESKLGSYKNMYGLKDHLLKITGKDFSENIKIK